MTDFTGTWDESQVAEFLTGVEIPIRISLQRPDGSPWIVTLWYRYRDGSFECATEATADVVKFIENEPTIGFDVSTNEIPYKGIRGYGTASIRDDGGKDVLRDLVDQYLGGRDSSLARWLLSDEREEVRIRIDPSVIYSWDYSARMSESN